MVFGIYTDNLVMGSWLSCVTGAGTNTGGVLMGLLARRLGNQKWQLVAAVFLGGSLLGCKFYPGQLKPDTYIVQRLHVLLLIT